MKTYTYHDLIETFIETQRHPIHPDFTRYYGGLLAALEDALGIVLSEPRIWERGVPANAQALWTVFASAARAYAAVVSPWDAILESGAMLHRVKQWEEGDTVVRRVSQLSGLARETQVAYMELIELLFHMMYGEVTQVVTSDDLRARGFDDATEPQLQDYL
jgi:hypothetical protein